MADGLSNDIIRRVVAKFSNLPTGDKNIANLENLILQELGAREGLVITAEMYSEGLSSEGAQEAKRKQELKDYVFAVASVNYEASKSIVESRLAASDFLQGTNWNSDLKLVNNFGEKFFKLENPKLSDYATATDTSFAVKSETIKDPNKLDEVIREPGSRQLHNMANFMIRRAMAHPDFELKEGETYLSKVKDIEEHLKEMRIERPDEFKTFAHKCTQDAKSCERGYNRIELSKHNDAYTAHMLGKEYEKDYERIRDIKDPQSRKEEFMKLNSQVLEDYISKNPEGIILKETLQKLQETGKYEDLDKLYNGVLDKMGIGQIIAEKIIETKDSIVEIAVDVKEGATKLLKNVCRILPGGEVECTDEHGNVIPKAEEGAKPIENKADKPTRGEKNGHDCDHHEKPKAPITDEIKAQADQAVASASGITSATSAGAAVQQAGIQVGQA